MRAQHPRTESIASLYFQRHIGQDGAVHVDLFGKPGCSLCDEALELLDDFREQFEFQIRRHNILEDHALFEKYRFRIPVLVIEGEERLSLTINAPNLETVLQAQFPRKGTP